LKAWKSPVNVHFLEPIGYAIAGAISSTEVPISANHTVRGRDRITSIAMIHCPGNTIPPDNISERFQVLISLESIPAAPIISSGNHFIDELHSHCFILIIKKNQGTPFCQEPAQFELKSSKKDKPVTCESVGNDLRASSNAAFYDGLLDERGTTAKGPIQPTSSNTTFYESDSCCTAPAFYRTGGVPDLLNVVVQLATPADAGGQPQLALAIHHFRGAGFFHPPRARCHLPAPTAIEPNGRIILTVRASSTRDQPNCKQRKQHT
jgi:hypothetical protein